MMPLFLGDVAVTKLVDCNPSMADIDGDSNRNASGTMIRIVIAKKKKKFRKNAEGISKKIRGKRRK